MVDPAAAAAAAAAVVVVAKMDQSRFGNDASMVAVVVVAEVAGTVADAGVDRRETMRGEC